jgi:hypothetical protein
MGQEHTIDDSDRTPVWRWPWVSGFLFLCVRGLLLWIVVPVAALAWMVGWPYWHHKRVGISQMLGWADLNLAAGLMRTIFRPVVQDPLRWCPLDEAGTVTHRVGFTAPI